MELDRETRLHLYKTMCRIRTFELTIIDQYRKGNVPGFLHLSPGQEGIAVGACCQLRPDDYIVSTHRGHGHMLAKGARSDLMMAEVFGRKTGYCAGKGGSMHIADPDIGILGATGIVGSGLVLANGPAFSAKYRGTDQVTLCFLGDGASNEGTFHEGLNMASLWQLPVVFICENNLYAESTPQCEHMRCENVADRAAAYNMPGVVLDGNDVLAVYEVVGAAIKQAREGGGPTLIECKTYRQRGHHEGDSQSYRTQEEVADWMERCPIKRFQEVLLQEGVNEEELKAIEHAAQEEMQAALKFSLDSPLPDVSEARDGIYTETTEAAHG